MRIRPVFSGDNEVSQSRERRGKRERRDVAVERIQKRGREGKGRGSMDPVLLPLWRDLFSVSFSFRRAFRERERDRNRVSVGD